MRRVKKSLVNYYLSYFMNVISRYVHSLGFIGVVVGDTVHVYIYMQ